jgi:hypothetical protein
MRIRQEAVFAKSMIEMPCTEHEHNGIDDEERLAGAASKNTGD